MEQYTATAPAAYLEPKLVSHIKGEFLIPSYQRGYRWGQEEVAQLLTDIAQNGDRVYCLQPIVTRRDGDAFRVIDGQQRLTTIYLLYKYFHDNDSHVCRPPQFSIQYATRPGSQDFLTLSYQEMTNRKDENIDYWFMWNAYTCIDAWFSDINRGPKLQLIEEMYHRLEQYVEVIWYETDASEDERKLFTRLNIGKIPLTSAELIKAMFLSSGDTPSDRLPRWQNEIALQWDLIEQDLAHESLWYFLTNDNATDHQTCIDLVLDLIASKTSKQRERYYTFFQFDKLLRPHGQRSGPDYLMKIWREEIMWTYATLKDWYEDHDLYHQIGYLITAKASTLQEIYQVSKGQTKSAFKQQLDSMIRKSIATGGKALEELNYNDDAKLISKILLLFNVESVRQIDGGAARFPFDEYKKQHYSLEHIHAQHSEALRDKASWIEWLRLQLGPLKNNPKHEDNIQSLVDQAQKHIETDTITHNEFRYLQDKITNSLSHDFKDGYIHTIGNLALLDCGANAALSNSTFDVKRREIIRIDQSGQFIPFCTKMVFLKYYTDQNDAQIHFWCEVDRQSYVEHIERILQNYINTEEATDEE